MRTLANIALSFAAGILLCCYLPEGMWRLWAAGALALAGLGLAAWKKCLAARPKLRRRVLLALFSLCAALVYFTGWRQLIVRPVTERFGTESAFSGTVLDYAQESSYGARVELSLDGYPGAKAYYYGSSELLPLEPGQKLSGTARWQDAGRIRESEITTFTSKGVFALLYDQDALEITDGAKGSLRFLPQRASHAFQEKIRDIWGESDATGFLLAELTGERSGISETDSQIVSEVGLSHLFAVSGLHCAFLVSLLAMLIPAHRRRTGAAMTILVLLFYMLMVGMTPSVVRACIMQIFLQLAPLFRRDGDSLTSLSAALLAILLCSPMAAQSISLQLSFAATLGILLLSGRMYRRAADAIHRKFEKNSGLCGALCFVAANVTVSLGALVFTIPLSAAYFGVLSVVSPLSNLLVVPVAGWNFMAAFVTVLVGFVWLPAAKLLGLAALGLTKYMLLAARLLARLPGHALYLNNKYLIAWLVFVYVLFTAAALLRGPVKRRYLLPSVLAVCTLVLSAWLGTLAYRTDTLAAVAVDVGQGECVLLTSQGDTALVDCGSSNNYINAGSRAIAQLGTMGAHRLKAVVLTHYHADHTSGLELLLERVEVERLYLPSLEDEYGVKDKICAIAAQKGIETVFVEDVESLTLGGATLRVYPPVGKKNQNEAGLTALCSAGSFDVLVTGDMPANTEKKLIADYDLPRVEVLLVGHHGSKYSSCEEFLRAVQPEYAIISVGSNSYGHPTAEAIGRLEDAGAEVYRTDEQGTILMKAEKAG